MMKIRRWLSLSAAFCLFLMSWGTVRAQTPDAEYFPETGHYVRGEFLRHYRSISNPTILFGYPLTEQFISKDGKTVQYFQRARFEESSGSINPTPLGQETYLPDRQIPVNNPLACRHFSVSGHSVCFAFLEFFDQNGGLARFGYPISPFEIHNNQIVQYFENARFEWRPGQPEGQRIGLTNLGRIYFDQLGEDPGFLRPLPPGDDAPGNVVLNLRVRAFPEEAVTTASDQQTIYVLVQDQNLQPIAGAEGVATIRLPSGGSLEQNFEIQENGVGKITFAYLDQPNGKLVSVDIHVKYSDLKGKTVTSFRIWY